MRTIKFRALQDNRFIYGQLIYDAIGMPRITEVDSSGQGLIFHNCVKGTESQFTGLKDIHGKEIYEGDIVKYYQPYSKKWKQHIVQWDDKFAGFGLFEKNNEYCKEYDWMKIKSIEIIGNIYVNPELS